MVGRLWEVFDSVGEVVEALEFILLRKGCVGETRKVSQEEFAVKARRHEYCQT